MSRVINVKPLASAIIVQAARDWDRYLRGKPVLKDNRLRNSMVEIKQFFESDWGQSLCEECDLDASVIQESLDKRLYDYLNQ